MFQAPLPRPAPSEDRGASLRVTVEATGETPGGWAWAIHLGADRTLIARSRALYRSERDAREAGGGAAAAVRRNLQLRAARVAAGRPGATFWTV